MAAMTGRDGAGRLRIGDTVRPARPLGEVPHPAEREARPSLQSHHSPTKGSTNGTKP
jgi:hypothetical protein